MHTEMLINDICQAIWNRNLEEKIANHNFIESK